MLPYGPPPVGAATAVLDWLRITHQGAVLTRYGTQSLPGFAFFFGWPSAVVLALELCCFAAVAFALDGDLVADRLAITDLRPAHADLQSEVALHAVTLDFEMQRAHAAHEHLAIVVDLHDEVRSPVRQTNQVDWHRAIAAIHSGIEGLDET